MTYDSTILRRLRTLENLTESPLEDHESVYSRQMEIDEAERMLASSLNEILEPGILT